MGQDGILRLAEGGFERNKNLAAPIKISDKWTRVLPDGSKVKLVAVFSPKNNPFSFWDPDGNPISGIPQWNNAGVADDELSVVFERPENIKGEMAAPDGKYYTTWALSNVQHGEALKGSYWGLESIEPVESKTISYGRGCGQWQDIAVVRSGQKIEYEGSYYTIGKVQRITRGLDTGQKPCIHVSMKYSFNPNIGIRLVAVSKSGKEYSMEPDDVFTGDFEKGQEMMYGKAVMGLSENDLDYLKLQKRPLAWTRFGNFAVKSKERLPAETGRSFSKTLPNGVTVELVGVSRNPTEGKQWWRPDGSLLDKSPYHTIGGGVVIQDDNEFKAYQFVARISGVNEEDMRWQVPGGTKSTYTGQPMDEAGQQIPDLRAMAVNQPRAKEISVVLIGIAAGDWKTAATHDSKIRERTYDIDGSAVSFGVAYEKDNITYLPITYTRDGFGDKAVRVFAVDYYGKEHTGSVSGSGGNILSSQTYEFKLPIEDVKEFQFKTRPYQWVTFKNVSLQLGVKTDVQIEVEGQSGANQQTGILKQIGDITNALIQAFNDGDINTILSYYTDDVMSLPDQHEAAIGKGALHKLQLEARQEGAKIYSLKGLEQQIWDCGDFVFEAGRCVASMKSPKLRYLLSDWRKSVTVWVRQPDGSLKIKLDSWNPDVIPDANVIPEPARPVVTMVASSVSSDSNMEAIYAQIKQKESTFHKTFIDRDAEAAIQFYADDAVIMSWGKDAVRGKANISSDIKKSMGEEPIVDMTQHVVHIEGNDQMLFAVNLFSWTFKDKSSGQNVTFPGKGVHVWKRQKDGSWKILLDLYNMNVPMQ
ncbi:MAG: hypothetical protein A2173_03305 [Planctomycetes bacterium RBG_13_44_8b]|nr:MAG: hypothetical protein A2173_03305 [Planctomycetes bacterium RBG_13_44_8b]